MAEDLAFFTPWRLPFILNSDSNWCSGERTVYVKTVDKKQYSIHFNT
jgi:hypothetical protein